MGEKFKTRLQGMGRLTSMLLALSVLVTVFGAPRSKEDIIQIKEAVEGEEVVVSEASAGPDLKCHGMSESCTNDYQCCKWGNYNMCCEFSMILADYVCHICQ